MARIGDTDRDGEEDFVAGVHDLRLWNPSDLEGTVQVTDSPTLLTWRDTDEWLTGVEPAVDLDGDGTLDIPVAAYGTDFHGPSSGSVYLVPSPF